MLRKLLISLSRGLLTMAGLAVCVPKYGTVFLAPLLLLDRPRPEFGFEACASAHEVFTSCRWEAGPTGGFGDRDPEELARTSLRWLRFVPTSGLWRQEQAPGLRLTYPSGQRRVRVFHDPQAGLPWEEQLAAWFERFPPTAELDRPRTSEGFDGSWTLSFGDRGEVRVWETNPDAAVEAMHSLAEELGGDRCFGAPTYFQVAVDTWVAPRTSSGYVVGTADPSELDRLPERLGAQMAAHR